MKVVAYLVLAVICLMGASSNPALAETKVEVTSDHLPFCTREKFEAQSECMINCLK